MTTVLCTTTVDRSYLFKNSLINQISPIQYTRTTLSIYYPFYYLYVYALSLIFDYNNRKSLKGIKRKLISDIEEINKQNC